MYIHMYLCIYINTVYPLHSETTRMLPAQKSSTFWYIICLYAYYFMIIFCITAILITIDARCHDFNGFPVVNWY